MKTLLFDVEADGFLDEVTKIHCLVIKDVDTGEVVRCNSQPTGEALTILTGIALLNTADYIIAHNAIKYDIPVIQKLYPQVRFEESKVIDTLILSRLIHADLGDLDTKLIQQEKLPGKLFRSHSLKAWGYRLGNLKDDYEGGFEQWSQEMEDYCLQDVATLHSLYLHLTAKPYSKQAIELEHKVAWIIAQQERNGFLFDQSKAVELLATLVQHKANLESQLVSSFPPLELKAGHIVPKKDDPKKGYKAGEYFQKYKLTTFNPGSRDHIAHWLKVIHKWEPQVFTEAGKPKVDETVLNSLPYPEAKLLAEYLMVIKRLGQLAEGEQAWLKQVGKDGRLHGSVITNGAVTGRATHSNPNMAQVPSVSSPYGDRCRGLFTVPKGKALVGADLSGLELRCLAHFMAKYDGGEYGNVLLNGDIHTANQKAAGLETRNQAKTFIYAFLYGAGDAKIGSIVGGTAEHGKKLKKKFFKQLPAIKALVDAVQAASGRGYLIGLDGRVLHIRSSHAALNTLLQSAGALIAKQALVIFNESTKDMVSVKQVAFIHDEIQIECDEDIADEIGKLAVDSFRRAGEHFNFRIPITGEYKVGRDWYETH